MATLHERAKLLSKSWGISYKEALEVEQGIDVNLKTKVKAASSPVENFYTWLMPGASEQPTSAASFADWLGL